LALASLGLSFTVGPVCGGYLARSFGPRAVFCSSLVLVLADVAYIAFVLPESKPPSVVVSAARLRKYRWRSPGGSSANHDPQADVREMDEEPPILPAAYNPLDALGVGVQASSGFTLFER
jgi:MFS family permease